MRLLPRLKPVKERNPVGIALIGLLIMTFIGLLAYNAASLPVVGNTGTVYTADFQEAAGLKDGDKVRIAGVQVGEVQSVALDGPKVKVSFSVDGWVGEDSRVGIGIATLLGSKYLAVEPLGSRAQDPDKRIEQGRTTSPYDVIEAFNGLSRTVGDLDTSKIEASFKVLASTFKDTPPSVRKAMTGLSGLSQTISTRNDQLGELLKGSKSVAKTLNDNSDEFESLLKNGNLLLGEIRFRRDSIHALLTGARDLGRELSGVVKDNKEQIGPALDALGRVTTVLERNKKSLDAALKAAGPYYRTVGNALGSGRWMDSYVCGLVPKNYVPAGTLPVTGCKPPKSGGR
ncbi:MCE family protein [Streptomyces sp. A7024]|uniref:MCE family protein n=1 Tax=Streptomyces coryli TaxID=1128680 RepID=A0A6G4U1U7_9ACTN|nr:MCE family protein [Streptomyces coryli]NGN65972.1 MCE family protein [Streptomyces coryli]